ncbi:SDR family oxidoreductase [Mesorhizobium sp. CA18]|uniref:glucose 1-dehydrogenase n=1 Tax=unclassified Mesorhizobium TaxID=325217 RepID=UPI001CC9221E|nr:MULTISPECIES: glucose 1-dehydrogenase [unclassified Mesorhizobium]MBZ9733539.1 SDR family oxidoreductase [Mesorhizobium sp. CA9]MBZ9824204.1 SDR family oxidoreductase [Mesorhizobium sp. CA18]MBZ9831310.1 SDR family oxidoreductase [Mesorhizobium sp. CA2]MBZ9837474.1 SDR family oxidoreductase [Mesorhizobium sp. CA3]MBZ9877242.1 SDR family oxidoreductase [Mesorhizobium sp. Ca11]
MSELFSLKGRVALVTGASRGLGFAMAKALAENGATVIVNARGTNALSTAAESIGAEALPFDVADAAVSRAALQGIVERHSRLDILINNAGIQHRRPLVEWEDEDFDHVIAVNLSACFRMMRDAVRLMLPNKFGRIINTGSVAAILGRPTIHAYVAAKAGLHGLTRSAAAEMGRHGITINAIAPGYFATELNTALINDEAFTKWVEARTPAGRWAKPEELGGAVVFLASDAAGYVNGHVLAVDGGLSVSL